MITDDAYNTIVMCVINKRVPLVLLDSKIAYRLRFSMGYRSLRVCDPPFEALSEARNKYAVLYATYNITRY